MKRDDKKSNIISKNKKAYFNFQIIEKFEAGIELKGSEVKSIRAGKINMSDAFVRIEKFQVFLYKCHISEYESASSWDDFSPTRSRRLLLHRKEINKLQGYYSQKGLALIAIDAHWKNGKVKIRIGVGRGKSKIDKRHDLKEKAEKKDIQRHLAMKIKNK